MSDSLTLTAASVRDLKQSRYESSGTPPVSTRSRSRHNKNELAHCLFDVRPASQTLAQHYSKSGPTWHAIHCSMRSAICSLPVYTRSRHIWMRCHHPSLPTPSTGIWPALDALSGGHYAVKYGTSVDAGHLTPN